MAPLAIGKQSFSSNMKRPAPPGILTNGLHSPTSPYPPLASAGQIQSSSKVTPVSANSNAKGDLSPAIRSATTRRRDAPLQINGLAPKKNIPTLPSRCSNGASNLIPSVQAQPYIKSDEYILKKYRNSSPSLVIHLHPTHFRFDNQEGHFPYQSPMRLMIEHLRQRTIPHDLVEFFGDVPYYEDCMIVQIHDHKSNASSQPQDHSDSPETQAVLFSIHNHSQYCTPSYSAYQVGGPNFKKFKTSSNKISPNKAEKKTNPNSSNLSAPAKPKILTVVLYPTPMSKFLNLGIHTADAFGVEEKAKHHPEMDVFVPISIPPTPTDTTSSNTQATVASKNLNHAIISKLRSENNLLSNVESQVTLATAAPLILEPVSCASASASLLEIQAHPLHQEKPPAPKTRKRTVAEMAADEALCAEQERFMLLLDERLSPNMTTGPSGSTSACAEGSTGVSIFESRFERFKLIESIRIKYQEKKQLEKQKAIEDERRHRQELEENRLRDEAEKRAEQERKNIAQLQQAQALQQTEQNRNRQKLVEQARPHQPNQAQIQHSHPQQNGLSQNLIPGQPPRFNQQVSQAQASSPSVRTGTPHNDSSPVVNNLNTASLQPSISSMSGSPRLGSSGQQQNHQQKNTSSSHSMAAQRSQQSHAGTPGVRVATPVKSTPTIRAISQTPRIPQGSPLHVQGQGQGLGQGHVQGHGQGRIPQTPQVQMINGQPILNNAAQAQVAQAQAQAIQQQRVHQFMRQQYQQRQAMAQSLGVGGIVQNHQPSPQQLMQAQQMLRNQQQQHNLQTQSVQGYTAPMAALAALSQRQQSQGSMTQGMNQNFISNAGGNVQQIPISMQQMQQMQHIQHLQQQQILQQAHAQHLVPQQQQTGRAHPQQDSINQTAHHHQIIALAHRIYQNEKEIFARQNPNMIMPEHIDRQMKSRAQISAQNQYNQARMRQQMRMQANMNGLQHQMGM